MTKCWAENRLKVTILGLPAGQLLAILNQLLKIVALETGAGLMLRAQLTFRYLLSNPTSSLLMISSPTARTGLFAMKLLKISTSQLQLLFEKTKMTLTASSAIKKETDGAGQNV